MARGKTVVLKTKEFATQLLATAFFKQMLNSYKPGDRVSDDDAEHLVELLKRHSEYESKLGCGIDHFEVMFADYSSQCFGVIRIDGTQDNFSYKHCIDQRPR